MANEKQTKKQQKQQQQQKPSDESSLVRISKIPIVEFSIYLTLTAYGKVKSSSDLIANVLNRAEKIAFSTFDSVKPVVINKMGNQVNYADSVANQVLDKLETTVPSVITFSPKNTYANSVNRLISLRNYAQNKVSTLSTLSFSRPVIAVLKGLDSKLDEYYPGTEDEARGMKDAEVDESILGRMLVIAGKIKRRSLHRFQNIQRLA